LAVVMTARAHTNRMKPPYALNHVLIDNVLKASGEPARSICLGPDREGLGACS
jgi:hypothetical protein